mgnify:CR=1 FL=1
MTTQRIIKIDGKDVLCRELCASEIRQAGDVWGDGRRYIISWGLAVAVGEERAGELWRPVEPAPTPEPASDPDGNYMLERALKAEFRVRELEAALQATLDSLTNWMEIEDKDDHRDYDNEAVKRAQEVLAKAKDGDKNYGSSRPVE